MAGHREIVVTWKEDWQLGDEADADMCKILFCTAFGSWDADES